MLVLIRWFACWQTPEQPHDLTNSSGLRKCVVDTPPILPSGGTFLSTKRVAFHSLWRRSFPGSRRQRFKSKFEERRLNVASDANVTAHRNRRPNDGMPVGIGFACRVSLRDLLRLPAGPSCCSALRDDHFQIDAVDHVDRIEQRLALRFDLLSFPWVGGRGQLNVTSKTQRGR